MKSKETKAVRDYRKIKEDYQFNPDIMNDEPERSNAVKEIISTKLSKVDKTIILLYVDCQSYRELGKRFGVSHTTIRKEVQRIKNIILKEYENNH